MLLNLSRFAIVSSQLPHEGWTSAPLRPAYLVAGNGVCRHAHSPSFPKSSTTSSTFPSAKKTLSHSLKWSWCVHCTPPRHSEAFAHIASQCISSRKSTLVPPNIVDGTRIMKHLPLSTIVIPPFPKSFSSNQTSETYPRLLARLPLWPARVDQL